VELQAQVSEDFLPTAGPWPDEEIDDHFDFINLAKTD
jgi:hypothetical protein